MGTFEDNIRPIMSRSMINLSLFALGIATLKIKSKVGTVKYAPLLLKTP